MATTIHGWPVIEQRNDPRLKNFRVPGTSRSLLLREDLGPYLIAFVADYHKAIAPIDNGTYDDWAWCEYRKGRASSKVSDHCAGLAVDINATREGSQGGASLTWWKSPIRRAKLAALRKRYKLLEWGGDYSAANRDPMHWTIKYGVTPAQIKAEMKRLGISAGGVRKP